MSMPFPTSGVVDLLGRGAGGFSQRRLEHPAGVTLPFARPSDAEIYIPEIRTAIGSGTYDADTISLLDKAVVSGDRVLVIGAGLGVVSTLIAKHRGVRRVIAVEADTTLLPYLGRMHAMNGVAQIETINAVLAEGEKGRAPFFARRDVRASSLLPADGPWQQVIMVPFMDLGLILSEERISLIVSEIPAAPANLLAQTMPGHVERIVSRLPVESLSAPQCRLTVLSRPRRSMGSISAPQHVVPREGRSPDRDRQRMAGVNVAHSP